MVRAEPRRSRIDQRRSDQRRSDQRRIDQRRIDQPRDPRRSWPRPRVDAEAFGRLSERIARFIGTARFLVYMTGVILVWVAYNIVTGIHYTSGHPGCASTGTRVETSAQCAGGLRPFDPYPFIFLTLALSLQASYAAPLILLAQNRQTDRDRVQYDEDRVRSDRAVADTEFLTREVAALRIALGEVATRDFLRSELQRLLDEMRESESSEDRGRSA